jgi:cytochrome bd-type quinol oxidase subunit 2
MIKPKPQSILSRKLHPVKLAMITILLMIAVMLILSLSSDQELESNKLFYWEIVLVFALAFALFSCVYSLNASNRTVYFISSILSYLSILVIGILLASYYSGLSIDKAGSFEWLFKLFSFCYLLLISVFNLMSTVMALIKKQDEDVRKEQGNRTS